MMAAYLEGSYAGLTTVAHALQRSCGSHMAEGMYRQCDGAQHMVTGLQDSSNCLTLQSLGLGPRYL